jgi:translation initiation factor 2B subunit (eIF-2B alpha/beta/delta family)
MAGGPGTAKECASALKVLAAKDPKSIHEIVSKHISTLSSKSETAAVTGPGAAEGQAAMDFISSLMTRGKQLHDDQTQERLKKAPANQEYIEKLRALLKSEPVVVPEAAFKAITQSYSREELLDIRQRLEARGLLHNPPEGLKAGLKVTRQTSKKNVLRGEE